MCYSYRTSKRKVKKSLDLCLGFSSLCVGCVTASHRRTKGAEERFSFCQKKVYVAGGGVVGREGWRTGRREGGREKEAAQVGSLCFPKFCDQSVRDSHTSTQPKSRANQWTTDSLPCPRLALSYSVNGTKLLSLPKLNFPAVRQNVRTRKDRTRKSVRKCGRAHSFP